MKLNSLDIRGVRNLQSVALSNLGNVNILYGENGAGKSSVLEAIHMLGLARSFRSTQIKPVIHYNSDECVVVGRAMADGAPGESVLGIRRLKKGGFTIKVDGQEVRSAIVLAESLPLQIINAASFLLLESGSKQRRQFLDWGVFHVEHQFVDAWKRTQRCIKQRNAHMRTSGKQDLDLTPWNRELVALAEFMDSSRQQYIELFEPVFIRCVEDLVDLKGISVHYRRGWSHEKPLSAVLKDSMLRDVERKVTHFGPHRADLKITINGLDVAQVLSRGQLKLLICAMRLAQMKLYQQTSKNKCILMVDDLPAEIDAEHQQRLCRIIDGLNAQLFITCIEPGAVSSFQWKNVSEVRLFHVKQGGVNLDE